MLLRFDDVEGWITCAGPIKEKNQQDEKLLIFEREKKKKGEEERDRD